MSPIPLSAIGPSPVSFSSSVRTSEPNWKISPGQVVMDILTGNWGKVAVFAPEKGIYQLRGGDPKSSDLSNQVFVISPASQFRIRPVHLLLRPKVALVLMLLPGSRACLHAASRAFLIEHVGIWRVHLLKAFNFIFNKTNLLGQRQKLPLGASDSLFHYPFERWGSDLAKQQP